MCACDSIATVHGLIYYTKSKSFSQIFFLFVNFLKTLSRLIESLDYYWDRTKQTLISCNQLMRDFPKSITVPQAVATWKHVAEYKESKQ